MRYNNLKIYMFVIVLIITCNFYGSGGWTTVLVDGTTISDEEKAYWNENLTSLIQYELEYLDHYHKLDLDQPIDYVTLQSLDSHIVQLIELRNMTHNFTDFVGLTNFDQQYLNRIASLKPYRVRIKEYLDHMNFAFVYRGHKYVIHDIYSYHIHAGDYFISNKQPTGAHSNFQNNRLSYFQPQFIKSGSHGIEQLELRNSRYPEQLRASSTYAIGWSEFLCDLKALQVVMSSASSIEETILDDEDVLKITGHSSDGCTLMVIYDKKNELIKSHFPLFKSVDIKKSNVIDNNKKPSEEDLEYLPINLDAVESGGFSYSDVNVHEEVRQPGQGKNRAKNKAKENAKKKKIEATEKAAEKAAALTIAAAQELADNEFLAVQADRVHQEIEAILEKNRENITEDITPYTNRIKDHNLDEANVDLFMRLYERYLTIENLFKMRDLGSNYQVTDDLFLWFFTLYDQIIELTNALVAYNQDKLTLRVVSYEIFLVHKILSTISTTYHLDKNFTQLLKQFKVQISLEKDKEKQTEMKIYFADYLKQMQSLLNNMSHNSFAIFQLNKESIVAATRYCPEKFVITKQAFDEVIKSLSTVIFEIKKSINKELQAMNEVKESL